MGSAQIRRFWDSVSVQPKGTGFGICLDHHDARTPAKSPLVLPTRALAQTVAAEWEAQPERIEPATMPHTRTANSAIDKVASQFNEVADGLSAYGDSDLLCYRAETPAGLVARQTGGWDPVLDWAAQALEARLVAHKGVIHVPQSKSQTQILAKQVHALTKFELAAFHDLVALTGSLILAFAATKRFQTVGDIWALSRIDENWQSEQWGFDDAEQARESVKRQSFFDAAIFFGLAREND